jgi:hypothetical protein
VHFIPCLQVFATLRQDQKSALKSYQPIGYQEAPHALEVRGSIKLG